MDSVVAFLKKNTNLIIEIQVHGDSRGSASLSTCIEQRRVMSIADYLVGNNLAIDRLIPKGFGDDVPVTYDNIDSLSGDILSIHRLISEYINHFKNEDSKKYEQLHRLNKRIEFVIFSTNYLS